jgi:hypothetical protein
VKMATGKYVAGQQFGEYMRTSWFKDLHFFSPINTTFFAYA